VNWKGDKRDKPDGPIICFRCNQEGHHRFDCKNPPLCYNCKEVGHMAQNCLMVKVNRGLKLCGFGLPGQMSYSMHVPLDEEDSTSKPITAVMIIREGVS
jgi:hypothetical protein